MLLKRFIEDGQTVCAAIPISMDENEKKCEMDLLSIGCRLIHTSIDRRGMNPLKDISLFCEYIKILHKYDPDTVLLYTIKPNVYGGLACRLKRVSYISTITGLGTAFNKKGMLRTIVVLLYRIGLKNASTVMFQNCANMCVFRDLKIGHNYRLIPGSGVDLTIHNFEPYPSDKMPISFTFVGRIMKDKGIEEFLEAAKAIKNEYPEVEFNLVGGFDESYQHNVEIYEKQGIVNYLGSHTDVHVFYKECSAVIMPSYHEGLCNVCLEGAATGRPLLASKIPGCIETFDDGVTGIGFEACSAKALEEAIRKFLSLNHEERANMGKLGRKKMEREFDRNIVVNAYIEEINKTDGRHAK